jgi:hypothetical protein
MVAARLMRGGHLHWSWAAAGLALVLLTQPAIARPTSAWAVAALGATVWGRRWHREDIEAGGDLAEIAARRRRPLDLLRSSAHAIAIRRRSLGADGWFLGEELILGRDEAGRAVSIPFGGASGGTHTLVVGATGSGKDGHADVDGGARNRARNGGDRDRPEG